MLMTHWNGTPAKSALPQSMEAWLADSVVALIDLPSTQERSAVCVSCVPVPLTVPGPPRRPSDFLRISPVTQQTFQICSMHPKTIATGCILESGAQQSGRLRQESALTAWQTRVVSSPSPMGEGARAC